jgi:hypothetical protein
LKGALFYIEWNLTLFLPLLTIMFINLILWIAVKLFMEADDDGGEGKEISAM